MTWFILVAFYGSATPIAVYDGRAACEEAARSAGQTTSASRMVCVPVADPRMALGFFWDGRASDDRPRN